MCWLVIPPTIEVGGGGQSVWSVGETLIHKLLLIEMKLAIQDH